MASDNNDTLRYFDVKTTEDANAFLQLYNSEANKWWMDLIRINYDLTATELSKIKTSNSMEDIAKKALSFAAKRDVLVGLIEYMETLKEKARTILTEGGSDG